MEKAKQKGPEGETRLDEPTLLISISLVFFHFFLLRKVGSMMVISGSMWAAETGMAGTTRVPI